MSMGRAGAVPARGGALVIASDVRDGHRVRVTQTVTTLCDSPDIRNRSQEVVRILAQMSACRDGLNRSLGLKCADIVRRRIERICY